MPPWARSLVSWSDSPLAPMATIDGRFSSWTRWVFVEGLCRLATLCVFVFGLVFVVWVMSWLPYWLLELLGFWSGNLISRDQYQDIFVSSRGLWVYWLPALVTLMVASGIVRHNVRTCEPRLSQAERRAAERAVERERSERTRDTQAVHETAVTSQETVAQDAYAIHTAATAAHHAPKHVSFYLVILAATVVVVRAFVVEPGMYPWHSSTDGAVAMVFATLGMLCVALIGVALGVYLGLLWVKAIRWWRYSAACKLVAWEPPEPTEEST